MQRTFLKMRHGLAFAFAAMLASTPAFAEKPAGVGNGKPAKQEMKQGPHGKPDAPDSKKAAKGSHFGDKQRAAVHDYFAAQGRTGRCPPGLAKKNNGCMPPGLAKQWSIGKPLPPDLTTYKIPRRLLDQLGKAPEGHKYVRVAGDILLIAIGTAMVVDAIEDLGNM